jgi:hypothetical protein
MGDHQARPPAPPIRLSKKLTMERQQMNIISSPRKHRATIDALLTTIKSNVAADKPEVVVTSVLYQIQVRSETLIVYINGSPTQLKVD